MVPGYCRRYGPAAGDRFSILISRPLRNIDRSIRKLGRGNSMNISINGPRDLRSLGERLDWLRRRLLLNWRRIRAAFCATCRTS